MSRTMFLDELEQHNGDIGDIRNAMKGGGITPELTKKFLAQFIRANDQILGSMDATTEIGKAPMAWCDTSLAWSGVSYKVKDAEGSERAILQNCTGHVPAGNLVAIMGPSGCGKSTLLDILAQKKTTPYEGTVYCNGHDIRGDPMFRRYATYVPQTDDMHEVLTVKETILFDLALKSPPLRATRPDPEVRQLIQDFFLSILGLDEVQNTIIGGSKSGLRGISGGQRRRVTLARGAVTGAQLLFADEPTSGLSATDAETCIKMLRFLCKRLGMTCMVVIHQPRVEVAELFDQLVLLTSSPGSWGGSVVYNGPMKSTLLHCERVGYPVPTRANPADWLMDMVTPGYRHALVKSGQKAQDQSVRDFADYYYKNEAPLVETAVEAAIAVPGLHPRKIVANRWQNFRGVLDEETIKNAPDLRENSRYVSTFMTQLMVLATVKRRLLLRDKKGLRLKVMMSVVQGLIVGIAYWNIASKPEFTHITYIFMIMQFSALSGMATMPGLIDTRAVMKKDVDEGLHSIPAWIISFSLPDLVINIVTNSLFILIVFAMGQLEWSIFGRFYSWVLMCQLVMDAYFNFIGSTAPNAQLAQLMAMPCMILFILFNGFLVSRESTPDFMAWALSVSPFSYAIARIAVDIYGPDACSTPGCVQLMTQYGFYDAPSEQAAIAVLVTLFCVFRVLQVFALSTLNKAER
jgi:ATP-binding cassette subfamily G (WHITE) protein 2